MKKWIVVLFTLLCWNMVFAQKETSQARGAILFMNYCNGCHSLQYLSWSSMLNDLELNTHNTTQIHPTYKLTLPDAVTSWPQIALATSDAKAWFGKMPPDLSLIAQQRGAKWIQNYLQGFYPDDQQRFGVNNHLFPQSKMPYVLEQLQLELSEQAFNEIIKDISDFLDYAAEPTHLKRKKLGYFVVGFLILFSGLFWLRFRVNYTNKNE